jgi:hypothetical protein
MLESQGESRKKKKIPRDFHNIFTRYGENLNPTGRHTGLPLHPLCFLLRDSPRQVVL